MVTITIGKHNFNFVCTNLFFLYGFCFVHLILGLPFP